MAYEKITFDDITGALIADDSGFGNKVSGIIDAEGAKPIYETRAFTEHGIDQFVQAVRTSFADVYATHPDTEDFAENGNADFEQVCLEHMLQHGMRIGDTVGSIGACVVLILDFEMKETIVYVSDKPVIGEFQGPIAMEMPDDLNLATLGEVGETPLATGMLIDTPRIVNDDGGMVQTGEFAIGPTILLFGADGMSFVKRYYQD